MTATSPLVATAATLIAAAGDPDPDALPAALADVTPMDMPLLLAMLARAVPNGVTLDRLRIGADLATAVRQRMRAAASTRRSGDEYAVLVRSLLAEQARPVPPPPTEARPLRPASPEMLARLVDAVCPPGNGGMAA